MGLAILSPVALAAFSVVSLAILAGSKAEVRTQAANLAHSILEQQRARPFDELVPSAPAALQAVPVDGAVLEPTVEIADQGALFMRQWSHGGLKTS